MSFVEEVKKKCENFNDNCIFNADQSGITKEFHSGRTLEFKGIIKIN